MPNEIMLEFIDDAREHLGAASTHLLALERNPNQPDEINGLLRRVHSIKGNAGFLDLRGLYSLLHKAENILQTVREENCASCPQGLLDVMFQVLDTVEVMVDQLSNDQTDDVEWLGRLIGSLESIDEALAGPAASEPADPPEPREAAPAKPAAKRSLPELPPEIDMAGDPADEMVRELREGIDLLARPLDGDPAEIKRLETMLDDMAGRMRHFGSEQAVRALSMARAYLAETHVYSRPLAGPPRELLRALFENIVAWLDASEAGTPITTDDRVEIMHLGEGELDDQGQAVRKRVEQLRRQGVNRIVFDLRNFQVLRSAQIGALVAASKQAGQGAKVGLILKPDAQHGLIRVFRLMGLEKVFRMFPDEQEARTGLA